MSQQPFDPQKLVRQAQAGNAGAQYQLAALLSGQNRKDDAVAWLRKAAAGGHMDARYTLATFALKGLNVPRNIPHAVTILEQNAAKAHGPSCQLFSVLKATGHGTDQNWADALDLLLVPAADGNPVAMRELALLLIWAGCEKRLADNLLRAAATRGDILALVPLVRRFLAGQGDVSAAYAKTAALALAEAGHPLGSGLAEQIHADPLSERQGAADVPSVRGGVIKKKLLAALETGNNCCVTILDRPRVRTSAGFIPRDIADYLIGQAAPRLHPSMILDPRSGQLIRDPYRLSSNMTFWPEDMDLVVCAVSEAMCRLAGVDRAHGEMLSILHYEPGERYEPHYDCLVDGQIGANEELARSGQRPATVLVYLNEDYEGGETRFCHADYEHTGNIGDALHFENILADGSIDEQSLHEGLEVTSGKKWIASMWIRDKVYQY